MGGTERTAAHRRAELKPEGDGDGVFHLKFGNGNVATIDGNKLAIDFDKAGQKRMQDSFVERG
ncbi:MAG: hypothetical protein K8H74_19670 [Notoacmeibacter sp.]|nr:hypothetical protein [Notoacmeibacter sp.]